VPALSPEDLVAFTAAVDGELARAWPAAKAAGADDADARLLDLWRTAAAQGWTELAAEGAFDALLAAVSRLGRVACPLPLVDVFVALELLADDEGLCTRIVAGEVRPVVATGSDLVARFAEGGFTATHVLVLMQDGAELRAVVSSAERPGLAVPAWSDLTLAEEVLARVTTTAEAIDRTKSTLRLGLVARALGAASKTLELSIEHAMNRRAFGKVIGSFQAVSHRAADGATAVMAGQQVVAEAVAARLAARTDAVLASELAVTFVGQAALDTQFGAQHTLAATGYFEEHDAPWLFRRVNADVARLDAFPLASGDVADVLIETGASLPTLSLGDDAEVFRAEVREFLAEFDRDVAVQSLDDDVSDDPVVLALRDRGWLTMAWPKEHGGLEASVERSTVLGEELSYARVPLAAKGAVEMLGAAIMRHGSEEQQQRLLPLLANGDFSFYLGYSEPELGSDLASLKTRAVRDGDEWVVNGSKLWGTGAHKADWVWLATRTDPDAAPRHAGITVFLTRVDRPGFELQRHTALSGETSCTTFFDDFRIPDSDRVGEVNGGWKVILTALAQERVLMANFAAELLRLLDDMLIEVRKDVPGSVGERGSAKRVLLSTLAARLHASRALVMAGTRATATGGGGFLEAPMAKIIASLLHEDFGEAALRIFGPVAALGEGNAEVPGRGAFEYNLRFSIMQVVGGGTVDIQRGLIARALGLPR
jgi:alkylation response protein AidB-like acyl-CoA dehydrogenase